MAASVSSINSYGFTSLNAPVPEVECENVVLDIVQLQDMTTSFHKFLAPGDDGWKGYFHKGGEFEELIAVLKDSKIREINFGLSVFGDRAIPGHGFNFNYYPDIEPDQTYVNILGMTNLNAPDAMAKFEGLKDAIPRFSGGDIAEDAYTALIVALEGNDFAWTPPEKGVQNVRIVLPVLDSQPKLSDSHIQLLDCIEFHKAHAPDGDILQKIGMPFRCHMEAHAIDSVQENFYGWDSYRFIKGGPKRKRGVLPGNVDNFPVVDEETQINYYESRYAAAWGPCLQYVREQLELANFPPIAGSDAYNVCLKHIKNATGKQSVKNTSELLSKFLTTKGMSEGEVPGDILGRGWQTDESQEHDPISLIFDSYITSRLLRDMLNSGKYKMRLIKDASEHRVGWVNVLCKDQSSTSNILGCLRNWLAGDADMNGNCQLGPSFWPKKGDTWPWSRNWGTSWSSGDDYNGFNPCMPVCQSSYNLGQPKPYNVLPAYARMYCVEWSDNVDWSGISPLVDAAGNYSNQFNEADQAVMAALLSGPLGFVNNIDVLGNDPTYKYGGSGPYHFKDYDSQDQLNSDINGSDFVTSEYLSTVTDRFFSSRYHSSNIIAPIVVANGTHVQGLYMALRGKCAPSCTKMCYGETQEPIQWSPYKCTNPELSESINTRTLYPCCVSTAFAVQADRRYTDDASTKLPTIKLQDKSRITPYWGMSYKNVNQIILQIIKERLPKCFEPTPSTSTTATAAPKQLRK